MNTVKLRLHHIAIITIIFFASCLSADAATITVTANSNNGPGSLRLAVSQAMAGDTIVFAPGIGVISLTSEIFISQGITIDGGAAGQNITGNNLTRIFNIPSDVPGTQVRLQRLVLGNGLAAGINGGMLGGAIFSNLTLTRLEIFSCAFLDNVAQGNSTFHNASGGAIYINGGNFTIIQGSSFVNNNALGFTSGTMNTRSRGRGGAIASVSPTARINIAGSVFSGNLAQGGNLLNTNGPSGGGAIQTEGGEIGIFSTTLNNNAATASGSHSVRGGALDIFNSLVVDDSTVRSNISSGYAGGIYFVGGTARIEDSTVSQNTAAGGFGGGIYSDGFGSGTILNVHRSLISGNVSQEDSVGALGGGIFSRNDVTNIVNSTIVTNTAIGSNANGLLIVSGGGVHHEGDILRLRNSTVTGNFAGASGGSSSQAQGGGVFSSGTASVRGTIIAGNSISGPTTVGIDVRGSFTGTSSNRGFNFIGTGDGSTGFVNGVDGDQVGSDSAPIDPQLFSLADNGGPTQTRLPRPNSPVVDKGAGSLNPITNQTIAEDQRGIAFIRPSDDPMIPNAAGGNGSDIGAVEVQFTMTAAEVEVSGRVLTADGRGVTNATVVITSQDGVSRYATTGRLGAYKFEQVEVNQTYTVHVISRRFSFEPKVVDVVDAIIDLDFVAETGFSKKVLKNVTRDTFF